MQKRLATTLVTALSMLSTPACAERFFCPDPIILPQTLHLNKPDSRGIKPVQAYLNNLTVITERCTRKKRPFQKNELTNCLLDHLSTLPDNKSLQKPSTEADLATLNLLKDEVAAAMQLTSRYQRRKLQVPYIHAWLEYKPRQR